MSWYATMGEDSLYAYNPIELLGLAAIYNHKSSSEDSPYWWVVDGACISDELYEDA